MNILRLFLITTFLSQHFVSNAQTTPRKVIIEHFTNTYCSVCASKNPTFYTSLQNYPEVLHLAYHPSSPYPQCYFNLQNMAENDARTTYYSVYGSTPRIAIEGKAIQASTPLLNTATLDTYLDKNAAVSIKLSQLLVGMDSMMVEIKVHRVAASDASSLSIYGAVSEDTINYEAANGEDVHFDVFRKELFPAEGTTISIPEIGDSVTVVSGYMINTAWEMDQLSVTVMVHDAVTKKILQVERISAYDMASALAENNSSGAPLILVQNPVQDYLLYTSEKEIQSITIVNTLGQKRDVSKAELQNQRIAVNDFPAGHYILIARFEEGSAAVKFMKR